MTSSTAGPTPPGASRADAHAPQPSDLLAALRAALAESYDVERLLGAGGMGSVFLARDRTLDRPVAIKVIAPELAAAATIRERFLHEARTVARLRHPNIVAVYTAGEAAGVLYFVMEYVPGESLRDRLTREGRFDDHAAVIALRDLARALAAAHARGLVHRDVKPENVLLDGETGRAMLTDFGVARAFAGAADGGLTGTGFVIGSPKYMSPEQAAGDREIDGRSDVYSLGLVAYEMFAGEAAVSGGSAASMIVKQLTETPPPLETRSDRVPPGVAAVVARALAKEPDARFPSAEAMAAALDESLTGELAAAPAGVGTSARRRAAGGSRRRLAVGAAAAAVALVAAGGWMLARTRGAVPGGVDPRKSYLVAPFEVQSGDPQLAWLREGSANMLAMNLAQWRDLDVVDYERSLDLLRDLKLEDARRLSLEDAQRLARRAGAWTVVVGQVAGIGDSLVVTARLYAVESGAKLDEANRSALRSADPRPLFDALARDLLDLAGAPASVSVARLAETTTSSVEAYRHYLDGVRALNAWQLGRADSLLARATALDTTFALAYYKRALARGWSDPGDSVQYTALDAAARHARRLPERGRALVDAYRTLAGAFAAQRGADTTAARAALLAAQQKYLAIVARDSADAEAWYGLGDAYWHDQGDAGRTATSWTRALRAFNRTLALDSSFHLAYSHKLTTYQAAAIPASGLVLAGDSLRILETGADRTAFGAERLAAAKRRAQELVVREARAWAVADPVQQAYVALANAYSANDQFDSAAAALTEAMARPAMRRGTIPFLRAALLARADPESAAAAAREAVRAADPAAIAEAGGATRGIEVFGAADAAALGGSLRDIAALERLAAAAQPRLGGADVPTASVVAWFGAGARLAMGAPPAEQLAAVDRGIAEFDRMKEAYAPQFRQQVAPVLYTAYVTSRNPRYRDAWRRWLGPTRQDFAELDALAALAAGDTAAARAATRRFPSADSLRAAGGRMNGARWVVRAEVLTALGDARRAVAAYEALEPTRFAASALVDAAFPLYARSFLARGRLYEELGERPKAAAAYERFLALWKDADPAFAPQLREARAGLARARDAAAGQAVR